MHSNKRALLHLSLIENIGPITTKKIIDYLEHLNMPLADIYRLSMADWMHQFGCTQAQAERLYAGLEDTHLLDTELNLLERHAVQLISIFDEEYPALLKEIHAPPVMLTVLGRSLPKDTKLNGTKYRDTKCLGVVGSRKGNAYGQAAVDCLVGPLVEHGWSIVSGGALGIDTMAHRATLAAGGETIAVLGSGLLQPYPASNRLLFKAIVESGGSLISPFPLMAPALPGNFPARNRIISGLSRGCVVIQAARKSGACITAFHALEQGREVFAVPGSIADQLSEGCHFLIGQGAKLVHTAADIVQEFGEVLEEYHPPSPYGYGATSLPSDFVSRKSSLTSYYAQGFVGRRSPDRSPTCSSYFAETRGAKHHHPPLPYGYGATRDVKGTVQGKSIENSKDVKRLGTKCLVEFCSQPTSIDQLMVLSSLPLEKLQAQLFELQLSGVIEQNFMGLWTAR